MIFIGASNDMRGGRTKFVDDSATKGFVFNKVVISVHRNHDEIMDMLKKAGHEKALHSMPSPEPQPQQGTCRGCQGIMFEYQMLEGKCIACWRERALMIGGGEHG